MKKAVVYLLTAVVITGSCLTPMVAYATSNDGDSTVVSEDKKADEDTSKAKAKTSENDGVSTQSEEDGKAKSETKSERDSTADESGDKATSDKTSSDESSKDSSTGTESKSEETKDESKQEDSTDTGKDNNETETPAEDNRPLQKLSATDNIEGVSAYLTGIADGASQNFIAKKNVIIIGYNYNVNEGNEVAMGFIAPSLIKDGNVTSLSFGEMDTSNADENSPETSEIKLNWNVLEGVKTLDDAQSYVKENINNLKIGASADKLISYESFWMMPESLVIFDGDTGNYIGRYCAESAQDGSGIYDDSYFQIGGSVEPTVSYDEGKTSAKLSFTFNLTYPDVLGGIGVSSFDIYSADETNHYFTSMDSLDYIGDAQNQSKGTVKDVPINTSGDMILRLNTTQGDYKVSFSVDKLNNTPEQETVDTRKASVSFSDPGSGILDGTPTSITMYSDIDSVLMFNGESSINTTKEYSFTVSHNGTYAWVATTASGEETSGTITVDCFVDEASAINLGSYGDGGSTFLPQTGGMSTLVVTLSGIFLMIGGIAIAKKEALMALLTKGRKV